jgi:hypothetical protein
MHRRSLLLRLVVFGALGSAGVVTAACANGKPPVAVGMSKAEVRRRLGPPERISKLDGKLLSTVTEDQEDRVSGRLAYFYRGGATVVWFQDGRVTSVTRQPAAAGPDPAKDH